MYAAYNAAFSLMASESTAGRGEPDDAGAVPAAAAVGLGVFPARRVFGDASFMLA
jgi:hypothetical protein